MSDAAVHAQFKGEEIDAAVHIKDEGEGTDAPVNPFAPLLGGRKLLTLDLAETAVKEATLRENSLGSGEERPPIINCILRPIETVKMDLLGNSVHRELDHRDEPSKHLVGRLSSAFEYTLARPPLLKQSHLVDSTLIFSEQLLLATWKQKANGSDASAALQWMAEQMYDYQIWIAIPLAVAQFAAQYAIDVSRKDRLSKHSQLAIEQLRKLVIRVTLNTGGAGTDNEARGTALQDAHLKRRSSRTESIDEIFYARWEEVAAGRLVPRHSWVVTDTPELLRKDLLHYFTFGQLGKIRRDAGAVPVKPLAQLFTEASYMVRGIMRPEGGWHMTEEERAAGPVPLAGSSQEWFVPRPVGTPRSPLVVERQETKVVDWLTAQSPPLRSLRPDYPEVQPASHTRRETLPSIKLELQEWEAPQTQTP